MVYPLAFLPYLVSLGLWLAATLTAFLTVVRRIAPHPLTPWLALAFPGTFQNFFNGQNGFLSTALLGGGLYLLNQSPWVAGFLLGLVSYKPHLFALVPVALIAARRWRALLAALITAMLLAVASFLLFGPGVWVAFWENLALPMTLAREGLLPINKLVTIFATLLQVGVGFSHALIIQGVVMVLVAAGVFYVWQRQDFLCTSGRGAGPRHLLVYALCLFLRSRFAGPAPGLAWVGRI